VGPIGTLMPASGYELREISIRMAPYRVFSHLSTQLASASDSARVPAVLRRKDKGVSIKASRDFHLFGATGPIQSIATETRLDRGDGSYFRRVAILPCSSERVVAVRMGDSNNYIDAIAMGAGEWITNHRNTDYSIKVLVPNIVYTIEAACYPPCIVATLEGVPDIHLILSDIPRGLALDIPDVPTCAPENDSYRVFNDPENLREAAMRVARFIQDLPGMSECLTSKGTALHPKEVVMLLFMLFMSVDPPYVISRPFSDVRRTILDCRNLGISDILVQVVTAALSAAGYFGGKYIIIPGNDGADLKRHTRYALYSKGHISQDPGLPILDFPIGDLAAMDVDEFTAELARIGAAEFEYDQHDDVDRALALGTLPDPEEESLGYTNAATYVDSARILGLNINLETFEAFSTDLIGDKAATREMAATLGSARHNRPGEVCLVMAKEVCRLATRAGLERSRATGTSSMAITAADMLGLRTAGDRYLVSASGQTCSVSALFVARDPSFRVLLARERDKISAIAQAEGIPGLLVPEGLYDSRQVLIGEAMQQGYLRTVSIPAVVQRLRTSGSLMDDMSSLSYIGSYGTVRM